MVMNFELYTFRKEVTFGTIMSFLILSNTEFSSKFIKLHFDLVIDWVENFNGHYTVTEIVLSSL